MGRRYVIARDKADGTREYLVRGPKRGQVMAGTRQNPITRWVDVEPAVYTDKLSEAPVGEFEDGWFEIHLEPGTYLVPLKRKAGR